MSTVDISRKRSDYKRLVISVRVVFTLFSGAGRCSAAYD